MFPFPPLVLLLFSLVSYWTRLIFAPLSTYSSFSYFFFSFCCLEEALMFNNTSDGCRVLCQSEAFLCSPVLVRGKGDISVLNPQSDPSSVSFPWISWHCRLCLLLLGFFSTEAFFGGFSLWGPLGLSAALAAPALSREMMDCDLQRPLSTSAALWCSEVGEKQEWRTKEWV